MADRSGLGPAWSRALRAHARYYEEWGRLTSSWLRELAGQDASDDRSPGPTAQDPGAALVLEGPGDAPVSGAFLVANTLDRRVTQAIEVGGFTGPTGAVRQLPVQVDPPEVDLEPGAEIVVRVTATVPADLAGEHRGLLRVDGMPGAEVSLLVRRTSG
ncbi:MAG: hypothetical protein ACOYY2_14290 [Actinomycetota bacterium]